MTDPEEERRKRAEKLAEEEKRKLLEHIQKNESVEETLKKYGKNQR